MVCGNACYTMSNNSLLLNVNLLLVYDKTYHVVTCRIWYVETIWYMVYGQAWFSLCSRCLIALCIMVYAIISVTTPDNV